MQGTILVLDSIAANRIMLKVQLSASYYRVVQAEQLDGAERIIARCKPDLILAADRLTDGHTADICNLRAKAAPDVPLMILGQENDRAARENGLRCGADDAMSRPLSDAVLMARIRRLVRERTQAEDLRPRDNLIRMLGLSEAAATFDRPARVAVLADSDDRAAALSAKLQPLTRHALHAVTPAQLHRRKQKHPDYDAILADFGDRADPGALRLLAELRSRSATRHIVIVAIRPISVNEALDLGADDVADPDCKPDELCLRLDRQLAIRNRSNSLRAVLQQGLKAAVRDPLTGLYNRRFALPYIARTASLARKSNQPFAVMLADIDHFKTINDRYGHPAGDCVIAETAQRLLTRVGSGDMVARVGGEEFLIVLENTDAKAARRKAETLCSAINGTPFPITSSSGHIPVTVSIGVVSVPRLMPGQPEDDIIHNLIGGADRALYAAKKTGRDRFSLVTAA